MFQARDTNLSGSDFQGYQRLAAQPEAVHALMVLVLLVALAAVQPLALL